MKPLAVLLVTLGFAVTSANAATLATPPLHPDPEGRLVCTVVNVGRRSFDMRAEIVSDTGDNVVDFAATSWSSDGERLTQVVVESSSDSARYCRIDIGTQRKAHVRASLEAFDANGVRTAVVEAR